MTIAPSLVSLRAMKSCSAFFAQIRPILGAICVDRCHWLAGGRIVSLRQASVFQPWHRVTEFVVVLSPHPGFVPDFSAGQGLPPVLRSDVRVDASLHGVYGGCGSPCVRLAHELRVCVNSGPLRPPTPRALQGTLIAGFERSHVPLKPLRSAALKFSFG